MRRTISTLLALLVFSSLAGAQLPRESDVSDIVLEKRDRVGMPSPPFPESNPYSLDKARLGRALFFDPVLSLDRTISCASCHRPDHGFASPERFPPGVGGRRPTRHAPAIMNRAYGKAQMWDGRRDTLESQVLDPISNELEMALPLEEALGRLGKDVAYVRRFESVFGRRPDRNALSHALSTFVRCLVSGGTRIDKFRAGEDVVLSADEKHGLWLFESKGRCWRCHDGPNFSDESFHNTGIGVVDGKALPGRGAITSSAADTGAFKTPTLRGLVQSAPYMHDGSLATLEDVVEFYDRGGNHNDHLDTLIKPLAFNDADKKALVAFLKALSN